MKTIKKYSILTLFFLFIFSNGFTQESEQSEKGYQKFGIHNVVLQLGYYSPSMDYWNDNYLPDLGIDEKFKGNLTYGGALDFRLPAHFRIRLAGSYWSYKVEVDEEIFFKSLKISFTRFSLGVIYAIAEDRIPVTPYVGLNGTFFLINNKLDRGGDISEEYGQDYSFEPIVGLEGALFKHFLLGLEFQYHFGNYVQDVNSTIGIVEEKVTVNGPEIILKLGYKF